MNEAITPPSGPEELQGYDLGWAQAIADRNGLPGFCAWRAGLERRYTVMPPWYWNEQDCRQRYIAHIRTALDWQARENRINRGNVEFQRSLGVRLHLD